MNQMNALYISDGFAAHEQTQRFKALHGLKKPILERFESMEILLRLKDPNQEHFLSVHSLPLKHFSVFSLESKFVRARICCFPLPFGRGEGQGEGLTWCRVHSCGVRKINTHSLTPTRSANRKVGQASRLPPSVRATTVLALTRSQGRRDACPTLTLSRFKSSTRVISFRRNLSPTEWEGEKWARWNVFFLLWRRFHRSTGIQCEPKPL